MDVSSCPVFGECGGCSTSTAVIDFLRRQGIHKITQHPAPKVGRRRVLLRVHAGPRTRVGFFKRGSIELCDVNQCLAAHPLISEVMGRIREFSCESSCKFQVQVDVVHQPKAEVYCKIRSIPENADQRLLFRDHLQQWFHVRLKGTPTSLVFCHEDQLWIHLDGFRQINAEVNQQLRSFIRETFRGGRVLDICAGNGNLGLALRQREFYTALESNIDSRHALVQNTAGTHTRLLSAWSSDLSQHDLVFYDPPRRPLDTNWHQMKSLARQAFVMVSCDVQQLPDDCFSDPDLVSVQIFDMFHGSSAKEVLMIFNGGA